MKTAAIILNHNLPEWTDNLYESLKPYERDDYDVIVFDNGSSKDKVSKYTTLVSEHNGYFGGGLEQARRFMMESGKYDSLLFLNNDLMVHGYNFVRELRNAMQGRVKVVSPCFFNIEPKGQCHWKTMHNHQSPVPRVVPFVDLQAPLLHMDVLLALGEIDPDLYWGWGIDVLIAHLCWKHDWQMVVCDNVSMLHYNSLTIKTGAAGVDMQSYCRNAEEGQRRYFTKMGLLKEFNDIRTEGNNYD